MFKGFLSLKPRCEACGLDYTFIDSGDGPAVFVMLFAGFVVVASALAVEVAWQPPYWLHAVLWLPLILITTLGPLRSVTLGQRVFTGVLVGFVFRIAQDLLGPSGLVFGFSPLLAVLVPAGICALAGVWLLRRAG